MNQQTSQLSEDPQLGAVSTVLKLECPFCLGTLNLRRIHLGIEGECVHCSKPVTAIEDESGCRLVSSIGIPDSPFPGKVDSGDSPIAMEESPEVIAHQIPEVRADPEPEPIAEKASEIAGAPPAELFQSPWGFPDKEKEEVPLNQINPASFSRLDPPAGPEPEPAISKPIESASPILPAVEAPFQSLSNGAGLFQKMEPVIPESEEVFDSPPPLPVQEDATPFSSQNAVSFQEAEQVMDVPSQPEAEPFQSSDVPPPLEAIEENDFQSPPPLEPSPAIPAARLVVAETTASPSVVSSQTLPGGISPFSTGSAKRAEPGFAEALFTADTAAKAVAPPALPHPAIPDMSPPDDVAYNAANQWGPPPSPKKSDREEPDFSAVSPTTQVKASTPDRSIPEKLPKKRKSGSGIFKKIFKFFLTIGIIGGLVFAANTFVPSAKWGEWKQQAIDWLEPGSVILEKLPFGKNKSTTTYAPAPKVKSEPRTIQEITEELLRIPERAP